MIRNGLVLTFSLLAACLGAQVKPAARPSFDYDVARQHEIKPHRRTIPHEGVGQGFNQLRLTLTVSPQGDLLDASATSDGDVLKYWPELKGEVRAWKFTPFEVDGKPVAAEVEEYIDLVPPERLPAKHVPATALKPDSSVTIALERTGCFGTCPGYTVTVSTEGIVFNGRHFVAAEGVHKAPVDPAEVRRLAKKFIDADFYSMDECYRAEVTDSPTYVLSLSIGGHAKQVMDYVGEWVGMPAVISELEEEVDSFAKTSRWIEGRQGLVPALKAEGFNFLSSQAQVMLKKAADRGQTRTVKELLEAGVSLVPLPAPEAKGFFMDEYIRQEGWLTAACSHLEVLQVLIQAEASKADQRDKDMALAGAAASGNLDSVRALIAYGANPNADLGEPTLKTAGEKTPPARQSYGSVLLRAAESANPEVVREILRYHPNLEARNQQGRTAVFQVGEAFGSLKNEDRVECLRLLVAAGADINARDNDGNTPLHGIYIAEIEKELLKLGAEVNARNKNGETPIFTNVDNDCVELFIEHGADLTVRDNKGKSVMRAAKDQGPLRVEALRQAIKKHKK